MDLDILNKIINKVEGTSSIENPKPNTLVYINNIKYYSEALEKVENLYVCCTPELAIACKKLNLFIVEEPEKVFRTIHNILADASKENFIPASAKIDSTAVIGGTGMRYFYPAFTDKKFRFIHIGNVIIGDSVEVDSYSIIDRGTLDSTIIGSGVKIGSLCHISHNCIIGDGTLILHGCHIGGSTKIGADCWIGMNSTIRGHITICDNVLIGMGSVVTKSITEEGIYYGNPAVRQGDRKGEVDVK